MNPSRSEFELIGIRWLKIFNSTKIRGLAVYLEKDIDGYGVFKQHISGKYDKHPMTWKYDCFFDKYVTSASTLKLFIQQYEVVIKAKFEKESEADYYSGYHVPSLLSKIKFEEQLSELCTINIFKKIDQMFSGMQCYIVERRGRSGNIWSWRWLRWSNEEVWCVIQFKILRSSV